MWDKAAEDEGTRGRTDAQFPQRGGKKDENIRETQSKQEECSGGERTRDGPRRGPLSRAEMSNGPPISQPGGTPL